MNFRYLPAYLSERFPPINMALFAILFATVYSVASFAFSASARLAIGLEEFWGVVATISFFYRLRVFDEIKDYQLDSINHPHRVLQSGRIQLKELTALAVVGTLLEIGWSLYMGLPSLLCWLLAMGYSLLMRYEFFVAEFLKKRLVLYAITHMLIMPLIILWIWSAYVPGLGMSTAYLILALLSLLAGFSFEIARKIHAAGSERPLVDSYSKTMGYTAAIVAVLLILLGGVLAQSYLLNLIQAGSWAYLAIGLLYLATLGVYGYTLRKPREKLLRTAEKLVSLFMLVSYLSIIIEVNL